MSMYTVFTVDMWNIPFISYQVHGHKTYKTKSQHICYLAMSYVTYKQLSLASDKYKQCWELSCTITKQYIILANPLLWPPA